MANTFITTGSSFKPYTFDEMIKPYQMYKEAYDKADSELNLLLEDAANKGFNFAPQDAAEKATYDNIMGKIKDASDKLASGLNPSLVKDIKKLNKEYRTTLIPIQKKLEKREELVKEQQRLKASNPNLRFTTDYSQSSLNDINDASTYGIIDLESTASEAMKEFSDITYNIINNNVTPTKIPGTDYYNVVTGVGYTPEEFKSKLVDTNSDVYKFYKKKADAIDARTDIDGTTKDEMKRSIIKGMEAGAGKFTTKQVHGKSSADNAIKSERIKLEDWSKADPNYDYYELRGAFYKVKKGGGEPIKVNGSSNNSSNNGNGNTSGYIFNGDVSFSFDVDDKGVHTITGTTDMSKGSNALGVPVPYNSELPSEVRAEIDALTNNNPQSVRIYKTVIKTSGIGDNKREAKVQYRVRSAGSIEKLPGEQVVIQNQGDGVGDNDIPA